jgi:protein involved in polysaccharide export with SLBB domain
VANSDVRLTPVEKLTTGPKMDGGQPQHLAAGDILSIDVITNLDKFPQRSTRLLLPANMIVAIDSEGAMSLGAMYGRVNLVGRSLLEAESAIASALSERIGKSAADRTDDEGGQKPADNELRINVRITYLGHESAGQATLLMRTLNLQGHGPMKIGPGDVLQIESLIDGLHTRRSVVEPDGNLAIGARWGRVNVAGKTLLESEEAIRSHIAMHVREPEIQVTYAGHSSDWSAGRPTETSDAAAMISQFERDIAELQIMLQEFKRLKPR